MGFGLFLSHTLLRASDPLLKGSILICHGLFGSKQNWKSISQALHRMACGNICLVDLRNHGMSPHSLDMSYFAMAQDVAKIVDELDLQDVCLVGHSMGGKVAMCAALLEPERFSRLMVVDSSPAYTSKANKIMPYLQLMMNVDFVQAKRESDGTLLGIRQWLFDTWKKDIPDETMRRFLLTNLEQREGECEWRVNLRAIAACWHHIVGFPDNELQGLTFSNPTIFVAGGRSDYVTLSDFPKIHRYFPQARLLTVEGAGHWVHVDDPHSVLHLITAFVKGSSEKPLLNGVVDLTDKGLALIGT
ncbi:hypothetical protein CRM22_009540 [Opisthorchis felineus]|uniref:sn-1-specific diacylglycerol lipase ABHD11 n=2 Tax=Opisthorchis felineus TaxID=147828 RepID=A0A4S2LE54_OPIFE|nr:hypothetical protein CRM22_009540 [Opisthorchis felineus]